MSSGYYYLADLIRRVSNKKDMQYDVFSKITNVVNVCIFHSHHVSFMCTTRVLVAPVYILIFPNLNMCKRDA